MDWAQMVPWAVAGATGALVAVAEIIPRYRDEPSRALNNQFGVIYLLLNGTLGLLAYQVWLSSTAAPAAATASPASPTGWRTLVDAFAAGLASATILRARVFNLRVGKEEYPIGPAILLNGLLGYLEKQIDRSRASQRIRVVKEVMTGRDFDAVKFHVGNMIAGGMQNLSADEKRELGSRISEIQQNPLFPPQEKAYELGFLILDFMGEDFLRSFFQTRSPSKAGAWTQWFRKE